MATLAELLHQHTDLGGPVATHLQRLVATWGVLSDLCFADLLLFVPVHGDDESLVVLGQVRPTTNQTLHLEDLVGHRMTSAQRPLVTKAWRLGSIVEGEVEIPSRNERARQVCIPVRWGDDLVAVLTRESALAVGRRPGELERVYVEVFDRFARMIARGEYPFPVDEEVTSESPGWVTGSWCSTPLGGSTTRHPTPLMPSTGWACTRASRESDSTSGASSRPR